MMTSVAQKNLPLRKTFRFVVPVESAPWTETQSEFSLLHYEKSKSGVKQIDTISLYQA